MKKLVFLIVQIHSVHVLKKRNDSFPVEFINLVDALQDIITRSIEEGVENGWEKPEIRDLMCHFGMACVDIDSLNLFKKYAKTL